MLNLVSNHPGNLTSFVIQGKATSQSYVENGWIYPSKYEIKDFYGVSGEFWTPKWIDRLTNEVG